MKALNVNIQNETTEELEFQVGQVGSVVDDGPETLVVVIRKKGEPPHFKNAEVEWWVRAASTEEKP